jgi:hypothetical protein
MNDFDFFHGSWTVVSRRLRTLFSGSDDWDVYPGTTTCSPIFEGGGNTEEILFPDRGFRGFTLRLFDVDRKEWSIYWPPTAPDRSDRRSQAPSPTTTPGPEPAPFRALDSKSRMTHVVAEDATSPGGIPRWPHRPGWSSSAPASSAARSPTS